MTSWNCRFVTITKMEKVVLRAKPATENVDNTLSLFFPLKLTAGQGAVLDHTFIRMHHCRFIYGLLFVSVVFSLSSRCAHLRRSPILLESAEQEIREAHIQTYISSNNISARNCAADGGKPAAHTEKTRTRGNTSAVISCTRAYRALGIKFT